MDIHYSYNNLTKKNFHSSLPLEGRTKASLKAEFQRWMKQFDWTYGVTVEPSPPQPWRQEEIEQRLRTLEFKINKHFLGNNFTNFPLENRFWSVGFPEGDSISSHKHWHILIYEPEYLYNKKDEKIVTKYINDIWLECGSKINDCEDRIIKPLHCLTSAPMGQISGIV